MTRPSTNPPRWPLAALIVLILVVAAVLVRADNPFAGSRRAELFGHIGASAAVTVAAAGLLYYRRKSHSLQTILWVGMLATIAFEVAQGVTPTRSVQMSDIASGFAGVLMAGVAVDGLSRLISRRAVLQLLGVGSLAGTAVLAAIFATSIGPQSTSLVEPDGVECSLTTLVGDGTRVDLTTAARNGACVETAVGGFGIVGTLPSSGLRDTDSVLITSPLPELQQAIVAEGRVTIRAEIVTDSFGSAPRWPGSVVTLEAGSDSAIQLMVRANRLEGASHSKPGPLTSTLVSTQGLEPSTRYVIELRADESTLTTLLDGEVVASSRIGPEVFDRLSGGDLRVLVGNTRSRTRPFLGQVDWIEVDVASAG